MTDLTSSTTMKIIPVRLFEQQRGKVKRIQFVFVAVQEDHSFMQWYFFYEGLSAPAELELLDGTSTLAANSVAEGFGKQRHEFKAETLHLRTPLRIDGLATGGDPKTSAGMFARTIKDNRVLIDLDIDFPGGALLQILRMNLQGYYDLPKRYRDVKGSLICWREPVRYVPNVLKHLPRAMELDA